MPGRTFNLDAVTDGMLPPLLVFRVLLCECCVLLLAFCGVPANMCTASFPYEVELY
jgi:hypothetical protein